MGMVTVMLARLCSEQEGTDRGADSWVLLGRGTLSPTLSPQFPPGRREHTPAHV